MQTCVDHVLRVRGWSSPHRLSRNVWHVTVATLSTFTATIATFAASDVSTAVARCDVRPAKCDQR